MSRFSTISRKSAQMAAVGLTGLMLGLAGCGSDGSDGAAGATGPQGPQGPQGPAGTVPAPTLDYSNATVVAELIEDRNRLVAEITDASIASPPVVSFKVTDSNGVAVTGIGSAMRFTLAKLVPGSGNEFGGWVNYINHFEEADSADPDVLAKALQAEYERATADQVVDHGDGTYTYTFAFDPEDSTAAVPVAYEPDLTHRVAMQFDGIDGAILPLNPSFDFVPSGGAGSGTRSIVSIDTCNTCHDNLTVHGRRNNTDYCVTCHNKGTRDADTGALVDMAHMVHAIHGSGDRTTDYQVVGFRESMHDYAHVTYPNDVTDCATCHTASQATPDGDLWKTNISAESCGGCHDSMLVTDEPDADTGLSTYGIRHEINSSIFIARNENCTTCHDNVIAPLGDQAHAEVGNHYSMELGSDYTIEILGADLAASPMTVDVRFLKAGEAANPFVDAEFTNGRQYMYLGWNSEEMYNGDEAGNVWFGSSGTRRGVTTDRQGYGFYVNLQDIPAINIPAQNADGSFTIELMSSYGVAETAGDEVALANPPAGSRPMVSQDLRLEFADGSRGYGESVVFYPAGSKARNLAVSEAKCNVCHGTISNHGGRGTNNLQVCFNCHNNDMNVAWDADGDGYSEAMDSGSLAVAVHKTHSADPVYRNGGAAEVTFPGNMGKCETCHDAGEYYGARDGARAITVHTGADYMVWTDDKADSPTAGVCSNCHVDQATRNHMLQNGGMFGVDKALFGAGASADNQEACAVCHGPGSIADTVEMHK